MSTVSMLNVVSTGPGSGMPGMTPIKARPVQQDAQELHLYLPSSVSLAGLAVSW